MEGGEGGRPGWLVPVLVALEQLASLYAYHAPVHKRLCASAFLCEDFRPKVGSEPAVLPLLCTFAWPCKIALCTSIHACHSSDNWVCAKAKQHYNA